MFKNKTGDCGMIKDCQNCDTYRKLLMYQEKEEKKKKQVRDWWKKNGKIYNGKRK